jgi:hypothetical protein
MTNAERQARHRERIKARLAFVEDPRAQLWQKAKPLIKALEAEGKKDIATMSPGTVAHLTAMLRLLLDPDYPAVVEERKAVRKLVRKLRRPPRTRSPDRGASSPAV